MIYNSQSQTLVGDSSSSSSSSGTPFTAHISAYLDTINTLHEIQQSSHLLLSSSSTLTNNMLFVLWEIQSFNRLLNTYSSSSSSLENSATTSFGSLQLSSLPTLPSIPSRLENRHTCVDDGDEAFSYKFISSVLPSLKPLADALTLKQSALISSSQSPINLALTLPHSASIGLDASSSQSYQFSHDESSSRNPSMAVVNAKAALFTTPTKDKRVNLKSPLQRQQSESTTTSQPSTRRATAANASSPRPVNLFNQSKTKKLKAIQSRYVFKTLLVVV
jgi:hypothetical protein